MNSFGCFSGLTEWSNGDTCYPRIESTKCSWLKLPSDPSCPLVGWLVGRWLGLSNNFLKKRKRTYSCSYQKTCSHLYFCTYEQIVITSLPPPLTIRTRSNPSVNTSRNSRSRQSINHSFFHKLYLLKIINKTYRKSHYRSYEILTGVVLVGATRYLQEQSLSGPRDTYRSSPCRSQ